ncbi:LacI family DNA-binding transcriptional regulator [Streptomyces sp. TRM66268-LWL]|uniref:LacI family DNA-binding transcriptional regulator n=1 Tax=Streptomyces polyasparticus TaxID=2767826 RepID=A0ABR7SXS3_9ACTN|nr:LacI family DNA-binding transcriptional regulator [Streptomyces polyasparticus]MBC9719336.1 LacI family DNA-binding transcriptional regulator [Streptomyces polyasparticus]
MATRQGFARSGGRPTLEEVAARAGVGRGTVSRVINGSPRVSDATREAVERAIAELGYVPNNAARALAANRTEAIALVIPEPGPRVFTEPYFAEIVRGVSAALADTSLQLLLTMAGSDRERRGLADYFGAHRVDGVLFVSLHADDPLPDLLDQLAIPTVVSGPRSADEPLASVDSDNAGGARLAVSHLLARGRTKIAAITGKLDVYGAQRRLAGYRETLADAGVGVDETLIEPGDFSEESGRLAMEALLARRPDLDAVFAASDVMAAGARQVLRESGRRIPEDVALIGYDDSPIARHLDPQLTSVRQPIAEMGRAMTEILLADIADPRPAAARRLDRPQLVLPSELMVRASS